MDKISELADQIELAMETKPVGILRSPSELARKIHANNLAVRTALEWMEAHVYVTSNGRGGCWRRFGRRH